jgi:fibronectin-binding autotransporter adhesin
LEAIFQDTAGTVTIDPGSVTANKLTFNVDGYTIDGGTLTLDGAESVLSAATGVTAIINAELARPASAATDRLLIAGPGNFDFGGGAGVSRKLHFSTDATLSGGLVDSSGTVNASNGMVVYNGATLTIDGATVGRVNGDADDALYVGRPSSSDADFASSGAVGTLVVNSGSFAVSGGRGITLGFGGNTEDNSLNVNGGTLTASQINIGWNGKGIVNLNGGTTTVTGAIQHNDGGLASELHLNSSATLVAGLIQNASNTVPFEVYLNGGTLKPANDGTVVLAPTTAGKSVPIDVFLSTAGAVVDSDGKSTEISADLEDLATNAGTLTKQGLGTLLLSGNNIYTGATTVSEGCLSITDLDAIPSLSAVSVAAGAGFGGIVGPSNLSSADIQSIIDNVNFTGGSSLVIDTNGADVTITANIPASIGLIKKGAGELTLTNPYTGTADVQGGTLVNPSAGGTITVDSFQKTGASEFTINFTSDSNVDVYRSTDLQSWGSPYATDQSSPYVDTAATGEKQFYILVPTGQAFP